MVAPDALWFMWQALTNWRDAAVIGPVMYYGSRPLTIWCAGVSRTAILSRTRFRTTLPDPLPDRLASDDFPNCFMVRRVDFEVVGGFDAERFPQHMEEGDLACRLALSTGKLAFCVPKAKIWHAIGTRFVERLHLHNNAERVYFVGHSRALYTALYGTRAQWIGYVLASMWALAAVHLLTIALAPSGRRVLAGSYIHGVKMGVWEGLGVGRHLRQTATGNNRGDAYRARRWLVISKRWLFAAIGFHIACAIVIAPVTSHPYDLAVITGNSEAWLRWGVSLFYNWKFGADYTLLTLAAQSSRAFLSALGTPGVIAIHVAWKLPLISANILTAAIIYRVSTKFRRDNASALAALWLFNPVTLWVSAGHGQIESVAILCVFASVLLALDGHLFLAGVCTGAGVGIEYFPAAVIGSVVVWSRGSYLPGRRPLLAYGLGLMSSLIVCFAPVLFDPVGRVGLLAGLSSSAHPGNVFGSSVLTVWTWGEPDSQVYGHSYFSLSPRRHSQLPWWPPNGVQLLVSCFSDPF